MAFELYRRTAVSVSGGILMLALGATVPSELSADTYRIYRCTADDGRIEFRQVPCATGTETELNIEDRPVGWVPPPADAVAKIKAKSKKRKSHRRKTARRSSAKSEEKCWNKRKQLEKVNWQLRRGYKAGQGVKLRRRRREYEEYLSRFCK